MGLNFRPYFVVERLNYLFLVFIHEITASDFVNGDSLYKASVYCVRWETGLRLLRCGVHELAEAAPRSIIKLTLPMWPKPQSLTARIRYHACVCSVCAFVRNSPETCSRASKKLDRAWTEVRRLKSICRVRQLFFSRRSSVVFTCFNSDTLQPILTRYVVVAYFSACSRTLFASAHLSCDIRVDLSASHFLFSVTRHSNWDYCTDG